MIKKLERETDADDYVLEVADKVNEIIDLLNQFKIINGKLIKK